MPFKRRLPVAKAAPAPAAAASPVAKAATAGNATGTDMLRSIVGLTPNPNNYSLQDAVGQLKAGNVSNQQNIMKGLVGLAPKTGSLQDAVNAGRSTPAAPMARASAPAPRMSGGPGMGARGMKKGGSVSSASKRGDGIARQGKTKGIQIKMAHGGKC